jgi:hypothetical protein
VDLALSKLGGNSAEMNRETFLVAYHAKKHHGAGKQVPFQA